MRKTTISLATFSSLFSLALIVVACGKRGDPLPPLRPVPGTAESVVVRQVGERLRLSWTAPVRNTDGTTENVGLSEARVLRRVLDLEALVNEQTVPVAPAPPPEAVAEAAPLEAEPETEAVASTEPPAEAASAVEAPAALPETEAGDVEISPPAPQRPVLKIPPFGGEIVATFDSRELGATLSHEEELEDAWIGKRIEYAVVYVNRRNRESPLSAVASIDPREPLAPPRDVVAEAGDGFVRVTWRPPESPTAEALGYTVYRREGSAAGFPERPLTGAALRELSTEDLSAAFGTRLCYAVKTLLLPPPSQEQVPEVDDEAVADSEPNPEVETQSVLVPIVPPIASPPSIESPLSEEACLTAVDRFPPPPASDLVAVPSASGILLTWREAEAPDLAGYRVYRSDRPDADYQLLAEVTGGSYTDAAAEPGRTYYYGVTAIDDAPSVNESPRTNVVEAMRP